jgi:queuine tRNA-ribosyltransferase
VIHHITQPIDQANSYYYNSYHYYHWFDAMVYHPPIGKHSWNITTTTTTTTSTTIPLSWHQNVRSRRYVSNHHHHHHHHAIHNREQNQKRNRIWGITFANSFVVPSSLQPLSLYRQHSKPTVVSFTTQVNWNRHLQNWMYRIFSKPKDDDTTIREAKESVVTTTTCSSILNNQQQHQPINNNHTATVSTNDENGSDTSIDTNSNDCVGTEQYVTKTKKKKKKMVSFPPLPTANDFPTWSYESRDYFHYELIHQSTKSSARVGRIHTPHGIIDTPAFVAVATNAALKGIDFQQFYTPICTSSDSISTTTTTNSPDFTSTKASSSSSSSQLIFCNTYHLMIQPGAEIIGAAGGIHAFTKRRTGPFITDSGGFQVFSLAYGSVAEDLATKGELKRSNKKISSTKDNNSNNHRGQLDGADAVQVTEDGVIFRSYRDGSKLLLTPETTVQAQKLIGADIIIPLDELPGYYVNRERLVESVARTHRWEARSLQEHLKNVQQQAMYCVIHGGMDYELRKESVDYLTSLPFDGYGIGGSLGNGRTELQELLTWLMPMFNNHTDPRVVAKPRHLLGIADEESIRNAVLHGIDTFDSCYPTRLGRHGTVLTRNGTVKLQSGIHARSFNVKIDDACTCTTCQTYDRAYLCHLFKANEPIATTLAATHNLHYMYDLMAQLRQDILDDKI